MFTEPFLYEDGFKLIAIYDKIKRWSFYFDIFE